MDIKFIFNFRRILHNRKTFRGISCLLVALLFFSNTSKSQIITDEGFEESAWVTVAANTSSSKTGGIGESTGNPVSSLTNAAFSYAVAVAPNPIGGTSTLIYGTLPVFASASATVSNTTSTASSTKAVAAGITTAVTMQIASSWKYSNSYTWYSAQGSFTSSAVINTTSSTNSTGTVSGTYANTWYGSVAAVVSNNMLSNSGNYINSGNQAILLDGNRNGFIITPLLSGVVSVSFYAFTATPATGFEVMANTVSTLTNAAAAVIARVATFPATLAANGKVATQSYTGSYYGSNVANTANSIGSGSWQQVSFTTNLPTNSSVYVKIQNFTGTQGDDVYIDDIEITQPGVYLLYEPIATGSAASPLDWNNASSIWQGSNDGGVTWTPSSVKPVSGTVDIPSGYYVSIGAATPVPNVTVEGTLDILSAGKLTFLVPANSLTVTGTLNNANIATTVFTTTAATCSFGPTGVYNYTGISGGQVPAATWDAASTINITSLTTAVTTGLTAGTPGTAGFGNIYFDNTNLGAVNGYKLFGGWGSTVAIQGNITLGRTGSATYVALTTGAQTITVGGNVYDYAGTYGLVSSGSATITVSGNFIVDATFNIGSTGYTNPTFAIGYAGTAGTLNVGGNITITSGYNAGTTVSQTATLERIGATASLVFNGSSTQTFTNNGTFSGTIGVTISNAAGVILANNTTITGALTFTAGAGNLNLNGNTLTVTGAITGMSATAAFTGSATSGLTITATSGTRTIYFDQTTDGTTNALSNLTISGAGGTTVLGNKLTVYTDINPSAGTLNLNGSNVVLVSTATTTASVDNTTGTLSGATNVTVQRYYNNLRSWRLVTAPFTAAGSPTINAGWQDGLVSTSYTSPSYGTPDYGTIITDGTTAANGFDQGTSSSPSIEYYNSATGLYGIPANTNSTTINSQQGWFLFVRGGRNYIIGNQYTTPMTAILAPTGTINTGTMTAISCAAGKYVVIGNPYPSTINFESIASSHTPSALTTAQNKYYLWDPRLQSSGATTAAGAWVAFAWNGTNYTRSVNAGVSGDYTPLDATGNIQSGSAFMVNFAALTSITIKEANKVSTSNSNSTQFRPSAGAEVQPVRQLSADLLSHNTDGSVDVNGGVAALFMDQYDSSDGIGVTSAGGGVSIVKGGQYLSIGMGPKIADKDTIQLNISGLSYKSYTWSIKAQNLVYDGLEGYLVDNYLGSRTPINLDSTTLVNFTATSAAPGSYAANRFFIVFDSLPSTDSLIAWQPQVSSNNVSVQWNVASEPKGTNYYKVWSSADGVNYSVAGTVSAVGGGDGLAYDFTDPNGTSGDNYYYVEGMGNNGSTSFSNTVDVKIGSGAASVAAYPNPAMAGSAVNLLFNEMAEGRYGIRLTDNLGQVVSSEEINNTGSSSTYSLPLSSTIAKGLYHLEAIGPDGSKTNTSLVIE